jgi:hypothetical protein
MKRRKEGENELKFNRIMTGKKRYDRRVLVKIQTYLDTNK